MEFAYRGWRGPSSAHSGRIRSLHLGTVGRPTRFVFRSGRPTRIAASILVCRLECLCRFGPVATNRCVDSSQLARFTPTDSSRCVDSGRPIQIAVSIHIGQLESMRRFRSAGRPPRIAVAIRVARRESFFGSCRPPDRAGSLLFRSARSARSCPLCDRLMRPLCAGLGHAPPIRASSAIASDHGRPTATGCVA